MATITKIIQLKDIQGNLLLPHAYSAAKDNNGNDIENTYATITLVNTKANDNAVVHLTSPETISGAKVFTDNIKIQRGDVNTRLLCQSSTIQQGTAPETNIFGGYSFFDKNGVELGTTYSCYDSSGNTSTGLWTRSPVVNSNDNERIYVACNSSGVFWTHAPTPSNASDNTTKIATTAWVNSHIDVNPNVVRTTGNQSISGVKIFTQASAPIKLLNNSVEQMTVPEAYSEQMIYGTDKNGIRIGSLGIAINEHGASRTYIEASKEINGTHIYNVFENYVDLNGNMSTYLQGKLVKAWVTESYASGMYWYRVWSDGFIEQGGAFGGQVGSWASVGITFAKAFANTNYSLFVQGNWSDASCSSCYVSAKSTTGATVTYANNNIGAQYSIYYACGY